MKKVFYSIGLVSMMMFAACTEDRGTSTEVVDANADESVNPATINDYEQPGTAASTASTTYTDADYQQHAQTISGQMANDLQLDEATATEVTRIYYDRNRQLGELEQGTSFSSTERMGGRTNESADMKAGTTDRTTGNTGNNDIGNNDATNNMGNNTGTTNQNQSQTGTTDRTQIDKTTDRELKAVLTPEQYRQYEQNRDRYNNMQLNNNTGTMNNGTGTDRGVNDNMNSTNRDNIRGTSTGTGTDKNTGTGNGTQRPTGGNQ